MTKRMGMDLAGLRRRSRTAFAIVRANGSRGILELGIILYRRAREKLKRRAPRFDNSTHPVSRPAHSIFATRVLIIATLDIPQCDKYRVRQKQLLLRRQGVESTVLSVWDFAGCTNALQTHTIAIFYRVPGFDSVLSLILEAKRLGVITIYETDDLIFDLQSYLKNRNIDRLPEDLRSSVLAGVPLFRKALTACDIGIASTIDLAAKMSEAGLKKVHVIENGIDEQTLEFVEQAQISCVRDPNLVRLFYGSGSKAHDADFDCAAPSILSVAQKYPNLRIRIVGELTLPPEFDLISSQIERYPLTDYLEYLKLLAECDINLAPLESTVFNDCKSNIKFIEAALLAIPSICSPRSAFRHIVSHLQCGMLAETADQWTASLTTLINSRELRTAMGQRSKQVAIERYSPADLARRDIQPLLDSYGSVEDTRLRILVANIYFSPDSFGGGTIIAEEMAVRLNARPDASVLVFSGAHNSAMKPYDTVRHEQKGIPIVSVKTPPPNPREIDFINRKMKNIFQDILLSYQPDVVHLHAVQGLTASIAEACVEASVPYVVTLHDAWWLCERQFMIKPNHRYCGQVTIDMNVCETCVQNISWTELRLNFLKSALRQASKLLAPSEFWKSIYVANGLRSDLVAVNKNGIKAPRAIGGGASRKDTKLRFGFVGGSGPIKGLDLIIRAFQELDSANYELVLVDNTLNLGFSSMPKHLRLKGTIKIAPAYTQDTIDDFFSTIDVLLFPSQWKESFGLTVREALVRDKWVIATDSGGTVEDIVHGENGTIIPLDGDHSNLRAAIAELLANPQKVIGHVNTYKARIRSFDDQAEELCALLKHAARSSTSRPDASPILRTSEQTPASEEHLGEINAYQIEELDRPVG
ncbi:glycosyltransferase [Bradyrhizobium elkanii]|uniref:glycosyltransferase n=1 Tax=Bradyrhizobium elkanii TaxID=29448 RepID=UPI003D1925B7